MTKRVSYYALVFPGLGDTTYPTTPLAIYAGDPTVTGANAYLNTPGLVSIDEMSAKIDPLKGSIDVGALSVEILTPPDGLVSITGVTFKIDQMLTRRQVEAQGLLASTLALSGTTSITLFSRDGARFAEGDVVYIENEAILLGALTASSAPNKTQTFTIAQRGAFGTAVRYHTATPGVGVPPSLASGFDNRVYTAPNPRGFEVYAVEYDQNLNTVEVRWRGVIIQEPRHAAGTASITLEIPDVWGILANRRLNTRPFGASGEGRSLDYFVQYDAFYFNLPADEFTSEYGPLLTRETSPTTAVLQIDKSLVPVQVTSTSEGWVYRAAFPTPSGRMLDSKRPGTDNDFDPRERGNLSAPEFIFELLPLGSAVTDNLGNYYGAAYAPSGGDAILAYHCLTAWLHHLLSTGTGQNSANYDKWGFTHGLGVPESLVDVAGIVALRAETSDVGGIHSLFLGADGQDYSSSEFFERVVLPFGFFPALTADYKITVKRLDVIVDVDVSLYADNIVFMSEDQRYGWEDAANSVKVKYQQPWQDNPGTVLAIDRPRYTSWFDPAPGDPKLVRDVTALPPDNQVDVSARQIAAKVLLDWVSKPIPVYVFEVDDPPVALYVGMRVAVSLLGGTGGEYYHGVWYDKNGDRVTSGTITGILTQCSRIWGENRYTVELWAVNDSLVATPKVIAPTYEVVSYDAIDNFVTVKLHADTDPLEIFGCPVRLFRPSTGDMAWNGTDAYGVFTYIDNVTATTMELWFSNTPTNIPVAGDWLRIATRADVVGALSDAYAFQADVFEVFGDGTDGDIYL